MAETIDNPTVDNPNPIPGITPAPVADPPVSISTNPLTPADPGHVKYDPLKDPRVKEYTDRIFSGMATKDKEVSDLKATIEGMKDSLSSFEKAKKDKEDAEKSEIQRATDQIAELEKSNSTLKTQLKDTNDTHKKEQTTLSAKLLIMQEVAKAGLKINNAEQRGLIQELEDKLKGMADTDNPDEIANNIVIEFKKERDVNFTAPETPPPVRPPTKVEVTDIDKQILQLSKGTITPEKEAKLKELLQEQDRLQNLQKRLSVNKADSTHIDNPTQIISGFFLFYTEGGEYIMANDTVMNVVTPANTSNLVSGTIPTVYSRRIYQQAMNLMLMSKFMGPEGSLMPIITKTDLVNEPGDTINIIRTLDLTTSAVTGRLKGNEEKIITEVVQCNPTIGRHGMAWQKLAAKRITFPMRERSIMLLSRRWRKTLDTSIWTAVQGSGTGFSGDVATKIWGGDATGLGDIDSTDTLDLDDIDRARYTLEAANAMPVGGEEGQYVAFLHARQCYYLGISDEWRGYQEDADVRGIDNWLFSGGKPYGGLKAFGYWNGVAIFKTNQCPLADSTSSPSIEVATGVVLGCEAIAHAVEGYAIEGGEVVEGIYYADEVDDYGNELGVGASMSYEDKILTSESIVQVATAAVDPNA